MGKELWIGLYLVFIVFAIYKLFIQEYIFGRKYQKIYEEILNKEEHKVKGQYDK